jgi:hypothetical protein
MSNAQEIQQVEISIEQAKASIRRMQCLDRLEKNPDFKELITDGFLKDHAIRQVMLKAAPQFQDEQRQKDFSNQIGAIGHFQQFLYAIRNLGLNAEKALADDEQTREELLAEDLNNG